MVIFHHFYLHFHSANDVEYLFLCLFTIFMTLMIQFSSFQFSRSVMSDSL